VGINGTDVLVTDPVSYRSYGAGSSGGMASSGGDGGVCLCLFGAEGRFGSTSWQGRLSGIPEA
jgi:hypothetical protein